MNTEVLELLRRNNRPRDWKKIAAGMHVHPVDNVGDKPVYEFFSTLDDSLEINLQSIAISVQPVNSYIPFHIHNYVELMVPLLGDCVVATKHGNFRVAQDDVIVMGARTVHQVQAIDDGSIVVNIALKRSAFSLNDFEFLRPVNNTTNISTLLLSILSNEDRSEGNYSIFGTKHNAKIVGVLYDIIQEFYAADGQSNQIIRLEILTLFLRLIRVASETDFRVKKQVNTGTNLLSLLLYIEKHYSTITLAAMADYFGFNPNYLSAFLKGKTGLTFIKLVHLQRINVAAEYLTYTSAPVDQIAIKVGYENPSYFYKVFRKHLGVSPSEYRAQHQLK